MVGLTRATIADPHLVRKTLEEGPDSVRPCIGCNQLCVANVFMGMPMQCTVNPVVGIEAQFPEASLSRAEKPKKVLVVGGGPAGMEVARVAAIRGHDVQLHEAMADLGGAVRLTRPIPHLSGLADIIFWQERELYERQVSVSLSSFIEADDVISKQPDVVIIATGSMPREDGWQLGAPWVRLDNLEEPFQLVASDLLEGRVRIEPGATVIIVDDRGHAEAAGVAEFLLSKGAIVEFVTRFGDFAPNIGLAWRQRPTLRRLNRTERFECHTHAYIDRVEKNGVVQIGSIVGAKTKQIRSDHILFVGFNHPLIGLKQELEAAGFAGRVELVGDSKSPRYLHAAIHEAFQTALTI
jgi:thioredoxin reductase